MRTRDGLELRGNTAAEVVHELHEASRSPCATDAEFARQMAGRAMLQTGRRIRPWPLEDFVADLVEAGLLLDE